MIVHDDWRSNTLQQVCSTESEPQTLLPAFFEFSNLIREGMCRDALRKHKAEKEVVGSYL